MKILSKKLKLYQKIFSLTESENSHMKLYFLGLSLRIKKHSLNKIDNNKILFITSNGAYTCNPKYIAQELLNQKCTYELIWAVNSWHLEYIKDFPDNIKFVVYDTPEYYKEYNSAKLIIMNERRLKEVKNKIYKKTGQIYLQTFHGSLGIKKTGIDRNDLSKRSIRISKKDSEQVDYLISNGKYTTDFFKRTFFDNGKILEFGHPRNDIFFCDNSCIKEKIFKKYNINNTNKVVLYAPTFRDDEDMSCFTMDYNLLLNFLKEKFGSDWTLLLRLHPRMLEFRNRFEINRTRNIVDVSLHSDIQELLSVSDVVITDYSSCIYDFMLTGRPAFIYASDIDKYNNSRGLYYSLSETPFPVSKNNDELQHNIKNFDFETYKLNLQKFLIEKGCIDDGHASSKVVELIESIMPQTDVVKNKK